MPWVDIGAAAAGLGVGGALLMLLDPALVRGWCARLHGRRPPRP